MRFHVVIRCRVIQGENNVFQCHNYNSSSQSGGGGESGGPVACGDVATGTGYACMMKVQRQGPYEAAQVVTNLSLMCI
jgi:hypothetical protein